MMQGIVIIPFQPRVRALCRFICHGSDVALRLALSVVAGGLIGLNRSEHGRPAGLRTTILVCLAATVAMVRPT